MADLGDGEDLGAAVPLTQEQLADILGVGRSYVSRVIQSLKARKLIETHRGSLTVADPDGLRGLACGCQASVRRHFEEVLKGVSIRTSRSSLPHEARGARAQPYRLRARQVMSSNCGLPRAKSRTA